MGVGLYHSYWQAAFGVLSLAAAKPLPNNQTEYPSNRLARPIFASEYSTDMGVGSFNSC